MGLKTSFGANLKRCRKEKRLSQEELSEKVDISVKHLSAIERGLTFVSAELLEKLSQSLEIPVFRFFIEENGFFYKEIILDNMDRIIEKHLIRTIEEIKAEIHQNQNG